MADGLGRPAVLPFMSVAMPWVQAVLVWANAFELEERTDEDDPDDPTTAAAAREKLAV